MATTKITSPDLFNLESLNSALKLPSGTTAQRPTSPSTGEWRYNTTTNLVEFWDGGAWRDLQSENIPPINSENFNTVIWTGTGSAQTIEVGFQPDMIWYKARNQAYDHNVYDSTRGLNVFIRPNSNIAQYSASDQITGVTSTGFTLGTGIDGNQNGTTFVAWCWKANGGFDTSAASFNGSSSKITTTPSITGNPVFSLSFWIQPNENNGTPLMLGTATAGQAFLTYITSGDKLNFGRWGDSLGDSTASIPTGLWTHVAISNNAGSVQLYINGSADLSFSTTYSINGNNLYLGAANTSQFFNGQINQFRLFNDAITASEVTDLYNETASTINTLNYPVGAGCIAAYPLQSDYNDLSGNYNGTPSNMSFRTTSFLTPTNTDGTITSTVQVNSKAGFSIVRNAGNGVQGATIGHGLGVAPELIILKDLTAANHWLVGNSSSGWTKAMHLDLSNADNASNLYWADTAPTSTVYSVGFTGGAYNVSGNDYISYCFASVAGYSKISSYTGNGSANGPIVNTGFEPAMIIIKRTDSVEDWKIIDNKRGFANTLEPNEAIAEETGNNSNFTVLSNGFQIGDTNGDFNANGGTYLYIAFGSDASAAPALADSFANKLWTGNGSARDINVGFSPSWTWIKSRSFARNNYLYDILRGPNNQILSNDTGAQANLTGRLTAFNTDGFSLGTDSEVNNNAETYVAWSWKANPVPTSNTDGSSQSVVSANQAAGFSIVQGTASGGLNTVNSFGHGLGVKPDLIIIKATTSVDNWYVYNSISGAGKSLYLNDSAAEFSTTNVWANTEPTASVFSIKDGQTVNVGATFITYCFTSISGFSKIGSYVGNATSNRAITGLGFAPSWVMIKNISESAKNWAIWDSARGGALTLFPNTAAAEANETGVFVSLDSDGFTVNQEATANGNGSTMIYMAFKENPTPYPLAGNMSFLVIAGGASGAVAHGGGGGAGGLRTSYGGSSGGGSSAESDITLAAGTYTITVGAGGGGATSGGANVSGNNGVDSSISASGLTTITSIGGGGGSSFAGQTTPGNGGSGGGGGNQSQAGGTGTAGQGYNGGTGSSSSSNYPSGGGGGAGAVGGNGSGTSAGNGGAGLETSITGSSVAYAGGAGGSSYVGGTAGTGGIGGGANGTNSNGVSNAGTANTGGGGSGATGATSGAGGSGVIILRLLTSEYSSSTTGSPTVTTDGTYTILTYTGSGTYVHS